MSNNSKEFNRVAKLREKRYQSGDMAEKDREDYRSSHHVAKVKKADNKEKYSKALDSMMGIKKDSKGKIDFGF